MTLRDFFITNTWWGKILGGFFGYLSGGATGAVFGVLVGNFFDQGLRKMYSDPHWLYHTQTQKVVQKVFFESTFAVMGYLAKADGRVTEEEVAVARQFMEEMRLSSEQKNLAKRLFNEGKLKTFDLSTTLDTLLSACRNNKELLRVFIDIQYKAAMVDGLSSNKINALNAVFTHLGFAPLHKQNRFYEEFSSTYYDEPEPKQRQSSSSYQKRPYHSPQSTLAQAFALLEVEPSATKQEVKKAYRRMISQNHPDKLISQGLPPEMIKLANDKTQKIVKAYEVICENKGW